MRKAFVPLLVVAGVMLAYAPVMIAQGAFEQSMGLVSKIMYFHAPSGMVMLVSAIVCGVSSALYLWKKKPSHDRLAMASAELTVLFGLLVIGTGPLWAKKAWGIWWDWEPRLTMTFVGWLISISYLFVRNYAGPGSDKLGAALAVFGTANVPFIYLSVNIWRTLHPKTTVVPTLPPGMRGPFWFCALTLFLLYLVLLTARVHLEEQQNALDELYLAQED
ncbi:MAG TPA: cytochrome c biogenesis protein CcsA [Vicinamibacterales bacterium]|nr:cytochrome c biogenesis protein CcsA [Vicinamibacterales bacterium]